MILRKAPSITTGLLLILSLTCAPVHAYSKRNIAKYTCDATFLGSALLTAYKSCTLYKANHGDTWGKLAILVAMGITSARAGLASVKSIYNTYRNTPAQKSTVEEDETGECPETDSDSHTGSESDTRYRYE